MSSPPRANRYVWRDDVHVSSSGASCGVMHIACAIARAFGEREVTVQMLRDMFGMSRCTAYRWQRAWRDANGVFNAVPPAGEIGRAHV